jgi:hypothetical protein
MKNMPHDKVNTPIEASAESKKSNDNKQSGKTFRVVLKPSVKGSRTDAEYEAAVTAVLARRNGKRPRSQSFSSIDSSTNGANRKRAA